MLLARDEHCARDLIELCRLKSQCLAQTVVQDLSGGDVCIDFGAVNASSLAWSRIDDLNLLKSKKCMSHESHVSYSCVSYCLVTFMSVFTACRFVAVRGGNRQPTVAVCQGLNQTVPDSFGRKN